MGEEEPLPPFFGGTYSFAPQVLMEPLARPLGGRALPVLQSLQAVGGGRGDRGSHSEGRTSSAGGSQVPEELTARASQEGFQEDGPLNFRFEGKEEEKCPKQRPVSTGGVQEWGVGRTRQEEPGPGGALNTKAVERCRFYGEKFAGAGGEAWRSVRRR